MTDSKIERPIEAQKLRIHCRNLSESQRELAAKLKSVQVVISEIAGILGKQGISTVLDTNQNITGAIIPYEDFLKLIELTEQGDDNGSDPGSEFANDGQGRKRSA